MRSKVPAIRLFLLTTSLAFIWGGMALAAGYPPYPKILTNKDWQKKKGVIAKMVGKTGIGDQMNKLEAKYKAVDWKQLDALSALQGKNQNKEKLEDFKKSSKAYYQKSVLPVREEALTLSRLADKVADEWKKSKKIPKGSRKHVEEVGKEALNFATAMKSIPDNVVLPNIQKVEKAIETKLEFARKNIKSMISTAKSKIKVVEKDPTKETYKKELHQRVRALCASVGVLPELSKHSKSCAEVSSDGFVVGVKNVDGQEMKKKLKELEGVLKKIEGDV